MIYESKVSFTSFDNNGNEKVFKQRYIVENAESFGDAETQTYQMCDGEDNLDVTDIKRSRLKEILNKRTSGDEYIWIAEVRDTFTNDEGEEQELTYKVAFYSKTIDSAMAYIKEYLRQGYDMELISLKKSNFVDVI